MIIENSTQFDTSGQCHYTLSMRFDHEIQQGSLRNSFFFTMNKVPKRLHTPSVLNFMATNYSSGGTRFSDYTNLISKFSCSLYSTESQNKDDSVLPASYYKWTDLHHMLDSWFVRFLQKFLWLGSEGRMTYAFMGVQLSWLRWEYKPRLIQKLANAIHYR